MLKLTVKVTEGENSNATSGLCLHDVDSDEKDSAKSNATVASNEKHGTREGDPSLVESRSTLLPKLRDTGPDRSTTGGHGYDDKARVHLVATVVSDAEIFE